VDPQNQWGPIGGSVCSLVRREDQIKEIKNALPNQELSNFAEFVVLNDLVVPHAFKEAVNSVSYVIHVASPIVCLVSISLTWSQRVSSFLLTPKTSAITMSGTCLDQL
jgi:hypothetical protein